MKQHLKFKLIALATKYDLDYQKYDYQAYDYQQIKRMILEDAGVKTAEMESEEFEAWEAMAEWMDSQALEDKVVALGATIPQTLPFHVLVFKIRRCRVGLAQKVLEAKFKGNFHRFGVIRQLDKRGRKMGEAIFWMVGIRETTDMILNELDKHNIYPRILRNQPFRRDFLHYFKGRFYHINRSTLKKVRQNVARFS